MSVSPIQPLAAFTRDCRALWATTYSIDLTLMNEFLLNQLGNPPLNATVLADATRLAHTLERVVAPQSLAFTNRRWLLRGTSVGAGTFHPKSYLAVTRSRATLLVGSGNLSHDGLGTGREVFTRYDTTTPAGAAALSAWLEWMRRLIEASDDVRLAQRFDDLRRRLPQLAKTRQPAPLLHNLDTALATQFYERIDGKAERVLLTAPFYDEQALAVGELLETLEPRRVDVWAAADTKVDGAALKRVLSGTPDAHVWRYTPDAFVHAKLVGVVTNAGCWLLSGSANLSTAALLRTPDEGGNVELACLARVADAEALEAHFLPPGGVAEAWPDEELSVLEFRHDPDPPALPIRLHSVTPLGEGLRITATPAPPATAALASEGGQVALRVDGDQLVTDSLPQQRLVWLVDDEGSAISNRVVIDDDVALRDALIERDDHNSDRPAELHAGDLDTTIGKMLAWFQQRLIGDAVETLEAQRGATTEEEGDAETGAEDVWARRDQEHLVSDPRAHTYRRLWAHAASDEPLMDLIAQLGRSAPGHPAATNPLGGLLERYRHHTDVAEAQAESDAEGEEAKPKKTWSASARIRVRLRNSLRRWADAQGDPHLSWIDPFAPLKNLTAAALILTVGVLERRRNPEQMPLTDDDLRDLALRWMTSVLGTEESPGWLDTLEAAAREELDAQMPPWTKSVLTFLAWYAVSHSGSELRPRLITWQPLVNRLLDADLVYMGDELERVCSLAVGISVTTEEITERLLTCATFEDHALWCERIAETLGLEGVELDKPPGTQTVALAATVRVAGIDTPLTDLRMLELIVAARRYTKRAGIALWAADGAWRLVVPADDTAAFLPRAGGGEMVETVVPLDDATLRSLLEQRAVLLQLFYGEQVA